MDAKNAKKKAKKDRKAASKIGETGDDENQSDSGDEPELNPSDYENDSDLFSDAN